MNITFLTPSDNLSGGNRVVAIYATALQKRGHNVLVVSNAPDKVTVRQKVRNFFKQVCNVHYQSSSAQAGHIALSNVPHHVLDKPRIIVADDLPDADVVIATWWETAAWMNELPVNKGRKVHLIQGYEIWFDPETNQKVKDTLRLPNLKITISENLRRDIEKDLGPLGIHVVPNAVDGELFNAPQRYKQPKPRVGFIYGSMPGKAADRYLAAVNLARRHIPDLSVLAFGAELPSSDLPLPSETSYHLNPHQADIPKLYAQCDAWLFASRIDSFGLPILEAMACRTPVIGIPVGAAPELLSDECGWLVNPTGESEANIVQALAATIVMVCKLDAATWQIHSDKSYERAHAYTWDIAADQMLSILTNS